MTPIEAPDTNLTVVRTEQRDGYTILYSDALRAMLSGKDGEWSITTPQSCTCEEFGKGRGCRHQKIAFPELAEIAANFPAKANVQMRVTEQKPRTPRVKAETAPADGPSPGRPTGAMRMVASWLRLWSQINLAVANVLDPPLESEDVL